MQPWKVTRLRHENRTPPRPSRSHVLRSRAIHLSVLAVGIALTGCGDADLVGQEADVLPGASSGASVTATTSPSATVRPSPSPTRAATLAPTAQPTPVPTVVPTAPPTPAPTPVPEARGPVLPAGALTSFDGAARVGQNATVCGVVVSPTYLSGGPTFLNLDVPYPNQHFTILIWPEDRSRYAHPPEEVFAGRLTCVAGFIGSYNGVAQIEARENTVWMP